MKVSRVASRTTCFLASVITCAVFTALFLTMAAPVHAARSVQLVGNNAAADIDGAQKSNIYFGNFKQSSDGNGGFKVEPIKWRVLENKDGRLFLLSDKNIVNSRYNSLESSTWETSSKRSWLNGYEPYSKTGFIAEIFTRCEQDAAAVTVVKTEPNPQYGTTGGNDTKDKLFILSLPEVTTESYGFNKDYSVADNGRKAVWTDYAAQNDPTRDGVWFLRTTGSRLSNRIAVRADGHIEGLGGVGVAVGKDQVRPAFNLDLGSVIMTSAAVGGKQSGDVGPGAMKAPGEYDGKDWKVTVKDKGREFNVTETEMMQHAGDTVTLHYSGSVVFDAEEAPNEYISAAIRNNNGELLYYGRIKQPETSEGTLDIRIPIALNKGTYDLLVFNEQYNGDRKTDYASELSSVRLTVQNPLVPYIDEAGKKQGTVECEPVNEDTETLSSGWYAVTRDVNRELPVAVDGNVNLILCDGVTYDISKGIAINTDSRLVIWAQSMGDRAGKLNTHGMSLGSNWGTAGISYASGDGSKGILIVRGGRIYAEGKSGGAGIGGASSGEGGNVSLFGGKVTAKSSKAVTVSSSAIGAGAQATEHGELEFGRVKVSIDGGSSYVNYDKRDTACRLKNAEILVERCSAHVYENDICKYCGSPRPLDITGSQVTLGKSLTYNGEVQTQTVEAVTMFMMMDITGFCDISGNQQKDAGTYELTITGIEEYGFTGSIKKQFTIAQAVPSFTVSAEEVTDDLDISAAVLKRSDESVPGTLALTEEALSYGTNTYHWKFTPEDSKNYETVTGTVDIKVTGHIWEFAGFEWTGNERDGYTAASAMYVCKNNAGHKENVSKVALSEKVTDATCTEAGKTEYTAVIEAEDSLDGTRQTESKEAKKTAKLGHDWDSGVVTKKATVKEQGEKKYTCRRCGATKTEVIPRKDPDDITPSDDNADDADVDDSIPTVKTGKIHTRGNFVKRQMKIIFPVSRKVLNYRIQYRLAGRTKWNNAWSKGTDRYVIKNLKKYSASEFRIAGYMKLKSGKWVRGKWSKISRRYMSATSQRRLKAGKRKLIVRWKKDRKATGYQVQWSLKRNMSKAKTKTVKGRPKTKYTIRKLKKGKIYYVKVRPYRVVNGKRYIGVLSGARKAKVK